MLIFRLAIAAALLSQLGGVDSRYVQSDSNPVLDACLVKVQDEVRIPAQEPGLLIEFPVKEGSRVAEGDLLAVIDDREATAMLRIAELALKAALQRAQDKIEERYATKAAEVAYADWQGDLKANLDNPQTVAESDIRQKKLIYEKSMLQIEKSQKGRELAKLDARTKEAERDAAKMALEWRTITAPFDGEVVSTYRKESEWVSPGDPILKLVRFDKLYVENFVDAQVFNRSDLQGKPVTVEIPRARGEEILVTGTLVYVSQELTTDGKSFRVRAEVQNRLKNNSWLIQPGVKARMTVHLDRPAASASSGKILGRSTR